MNNLIQPKIENETILQLPRIQYDGNVIIADNIEKITKVIEHIKNISILGFDTETKPSFKKGIKNKISLIQFALDDLVILIRINKTGLTDEIISVLTDKNIKKIGLSIRDDLRELQKLKHFSPAGFIDLQEYVQYFGIKDQSLKKITALVLGRRISKSQQTSNWNNEVLSEPQIIYAATDAWICLKIYQKLKEIENNNSINISK